MRERVAGYIRNLLPWCYEPPDPTLDETNLTVYDVTSHAAEIDLSSLGIIEWAPVWMCRAERLLLYTLVFTLRPLRYLEIGTFKGGSAMVVAAAMDSVGNPGQLVCVDPHFQIAPDHWELIAHRTTLLTGSSPEILPQAYNQAGGLFDLALVDGEHSYGGVVRDAQAVLPFMADGGYILFHDSLCPEVARGLHDFVQECTTDIVDFGTLTREVTYQDDGQGNQMRWGGLRLMQVRRHRDRD